MNRLRSASRIAAYIQVVHERGLPWWGWETSLREYRLWLDDDREAKEGIIDATLRERGVPDALTYHPAIHQLHFALMGACVLAGTFLAGQDPRAENLVAACVLAVIVALFTYEAVRSRPRKTCSLIERNVIIWEHVLSRSNTKNEAHGKRDGAV